jgi:hypothetical protein
LNRLVAAELQAESGVVDLRCIDADVVNMDIAFA